MHLRDLQADFGLCICVDLCVLWANNNVHLGMTRIACLFIPLFPLAARLRAEPELAGETVAVCEGNGSVAKVAGASRPARKSGVRSGMTLAQARGILPSLIARGRDTACEASAHEALLEAATTLSPRVEDAASDVVFADVSGMERLYEGDDGERNMGQTAIIAAEAIDLPIRVGIAGNKLAARIAARMPDSPKVVAAGTEARFLAPLPLRHLALDRRLMDTLRRWGVRSLGDFARLPADRTASRLGPAGATAHRLARGMDSDPLAPYHPPPVFQEGMELEWPVVTVDPLIYAMRQSLERTRKRLEREDLACTLLELELGLEPDGSERRTIRLPAPTRDVDALLALTRLELECKPPRAAVVAFITITHPDRPRRGQLTLFGAPDIDPDKLAGSLAHLAARIGPERVGSPRTVNGHLPERYGSEPFEPPPAPKIRQPPRSGRGLLVIRVLRPPVPLEVITEATSDAGCSMLDAGPERPQSDVEGGRAAIPNSEFRIPNSFRLISIASESGATPRIQGLVRVAAGPWTLEDGWWNERPVERDYWDVELSGGGLYRIYRDRTSGDWFADGMYD
ncbi:MAG: DNA polymerase Y family protein [Holophagae bacterium]